MRATYIIIQSLEATYKGPTMFLMILAIRVTQRFIKVYVPVTLTYLTTHICGPVNNRAFSNLNMFPWVLYGDEII